MCDPLIEGPRETKENDYQINVISDTTECDYHIYYLYRYFILNIVNTYRMSWKK